jgi:hypothetical protein
MNGFLDRRDGIRRKKTTVFEGLDQWLEWPKYFGISGPFCRLTASNPVGEVQRGDDPAEPCVVPQSSFLGSAADPANYVPSCKILSITSQLSPAEDVSSQDRDSTPKR